MEKEEITKSEEKAKKPKGKVRKIIEWSVTGLFIALVGVLIGIKIYQKNTHTSLFGTQYPIVLTDSMETDYMVDDVLIVKEVNPSEIAIGDDITFLWDLSGKGDVYPMTHRIIEATYYPDASLNKGYNYTFVAHGINKNSSQCRGDCTYQTQEFHEDVLIGKVTGKSPFLRVMYKILTSVWTLIILILIPCLYIMITAVIDMFKKLEEQERLQEIEAIEKGEYKPNKSNSGEDPLKDLSEKDKERLKKELLEEMLNKKKEKK